MPWVIVRQNKEKPEKVRVIFNGNGGKLYIGANSEQRSFADAKRLNEVYGHKYAYTAVELV